MALSQHLTRWIMASVEKHFRARLQGITMFVEGQMRDTRTLKDFAELRVDGPNFTELSKDYWNVYIEINILIQSAQDQDNRYRIYNTIGIMAAAFEGIIKILRLGDGSSDDQSLIGCIKLQGDKDANERIKISHFGQIEAKTDIFQSTVEGHYAMELRE